MIACVDSSVLLRIILGHRDALAEWTSIETGVASALVEVECLRTLDRLRLHAGIADRAIAERRATVFQLLEAMEIVEATRPILARASLPLPTALGTLDAIHLATALAWRETTDSQIVMATHATALGLAARASGLAVIGM